MNPSVVLLFQVWCGGGIHRAGPAAAGSTGEVEREGCAQRTEGSREEIGAIWQRGSAAPASRGCGNVQKKRKAGDDAVEEEPSEDREEVDASEGGGKRRRLDLNKIINRRLQQKDEELELRRKELELRRKELELRRKELELAQE